jgi:hypothetical protein
MKNAADKTASVMRIAQCDENPHVIWRKQRKEEPIHHHIVPRLSSCGMLLSPSKEHCFPGEKIYLHSSRSLHQSHGRLKINLSAPGGVY